MSEGVEPPPALNRLAVGGLVGSILLALAGMFAVPPLMDLGLTFTRAFVVVAAAEVGAAVGVVVSTLNLYDDGGL